MTQFSVTWREPAISNGVVINYYILVYNATTIDRSLVAQNSVPGTARSVVVTGLSECELQSLSLLEPPPFCHLLLTFP